MERSGAAIWLFAKSAVDVNTRASLGYKNRYAAFSKGWEKMTETAKIKPKRIALITLRRGIKDFQEYSEGISAAVREIAKGNRGSLVVDRPDVGAFRAVSRRGERKYNAILVECYALPPDLPELINPWKIIGKATRTPVVVLWPDYYRYETDVVHNLLDRTPYFEILFCANGNAEWGIRDFLQKRDILPRRWEDMEGRVRFRNLLGNSGKERV